MYPILTAPEFLNHRSYTQSLRCGRLIRRPLRAVQSRNDCFNTEMIDAARVFSELNAGSAILTNGLTFIYLSVRN